MIQAIIESMDQLLENEGVDITSIASVGIGIPGTVNSDTGVVLFAPNIFWENVNVRIPLEDHFKIPVYLAQDTRAVAWGSIYMVLAKDIKP